MPSRSNERYELSLEGRQIAGLVAGSLGTLAIVFAMGVGFGRQLALAPAPVAPPKDLQHLDSKPAAPAIADTGFTFHESLVKGDPAVVATAKPPPPPPAPAPVAAPPPPVPVVTAPAAAPAAAAPAIAEAKVEAPAPVPAAEPKVELAAAKPVAAPKPEAKPEPVKDDPPAPAAAAPKKDEPATWAVQFGASQNRGEADKLAATLLDYGYTPYVVVADIPGKGRFYRVRVGHFANKDQADKLRADAQTKHKLGGMVMPAK